MMNPLLSVDFGPSGQIKSMNWYKDQVRSLFENTTPTSLMRNQERLVTRIDPGKMYCFFYDPKLKAELSFYDKFPLIFPYKAIQGGFMGLNLHYLPYQLRFSLLNKLMVYRSDKKMDENTKLRLSWQTLSAAATHTLIKPCVKHYLTDHVQSKFLSIHSDEWHTTIMLPVESFAKATKTQVWNHSKKKMGM